MTKTRFPKTFGSTEELQQLLREDLAVLLAERFLLPAAAEEAEQCRPRPCTGPHRFLGR